MPISASVCTSACVRTMPVPPGPAIAPVAISATMCGTCSRARATITASASAKVRISSPSRASSSTQSSALSVGLQARRQVLRGLSISISSMGSGKMIVEFFSAAMSVSVCR